MALGILYIGEIGIMEMKMEATMIYSGYIGNMALGISYIKIPHITP